MNNVLNQSPLIHDHLAVNPSELLQDEIRRLARDLIRAGHEHVSEIGQNPVVSVHQTRKRLKELRALLRMVRDSLGHQFYRTENIRLRDAGRLLSHARDCAVLIALFDEHFTRFGRDYSTYALKAVREGLYKEHQEAVEAVVKGNAIQEVQNALQQTEERIAVWPLHRKDFSLLMDGIWRVYRRGLGRLHKTRINPTDERLHEWRKQVKYLWYHTRMIAPAWPPLLSGLAKALHNLSETLGDDHDLSVLTHKLHEVSSIPSDLLLSQLYWARQQQERLRREAWSLGARLYTESPKAFSARMKTYWVSAARPSKPQQTPQR